MTPEEIVKQLRAPLVNYGSVVFLIEAADLIERQATALEEIQAEIVRLREALKDVLLDIDFMVEDGLIADIRNDVLYERARAALNGGRGG